LATLCVKLHEVLLTIEFVIGANEEATAREGLRAVLTDEVIRVIVLAESLGNLTNDRLMANCTIRTNRDIIAHNLRLLLLHEEVRIVVTSWSRRDDRSTNRANTISNGTGHHIVRLGT